MKIWLLWVRADEGRDSWTWLEAAMSDDSIAENGDAWDAEVKRVREMCLGDRTLTYRLQAVSVPGVDDLFKIPEVEAHIA